MNAEQRLKDLISEYCALKTNEDKAAFDEKMVSILAEMNRDECTAFRKAFLISAQHTVSKAIEIRKEGKMKYRPV